MGSNEKRQKTIEHALSRRTVFQSWYPAGTYVLVCVKTGAHVTALRREDNHGGHVAACAKFEKKYGLSPFREYVGIAV
jgi:hypothetical protein